jgi:hypothetical protein
VTQTKIPTWVTLRQVPKEFQSVSHQIAVGIGEVLGADEANGSLEDPKFCLALDSGAGWEPTVLVTNSISQTKATILIDYNYLPIRCRYCLSTDHCIKDCPIKSVIRKPRTSQGPNRYQRNSGWNSSQQVASRQTAGKKGQPLSAGSMKNNNLERTNLKGNSEGAQMHTRAVIPPVDKDGF